MKTILALAATGLIALAAPAFAQSAGAPGATGTGGSLTGSNPGTGWRNGQYYGDNINPGPGYSQYPNNPGNGDYGYNNGYRDNGYGYNNGYNNGYRDNGYGYDNGYRENGYNNGYMNEGRAAARDYDGPDYGVPSDAWRPRSQNPGVGADLVGPGSSMDNPTDGHDVSR